MNRLSASNNQGPMPTYEGRQLANPDEDIFDQGLAFDLQTLVGRRQVLKLIGYAGVGTGLFALVGCLPSGSSASGETSASASASTSEAPMS